MENYVLSPELTRRLLAFAAEQQRTPDEVLEAILSSEMPIEIDSLTDTIPPEGSLARLAYEARRLQMQVGMPNESNYDKKALRDELADTLLDRLEESRDSDE